MAKINNGAIKASADSAMTEESSNKKPQVAMINFYLPMFTALGLGFSYLILLLLSHLFMPSGNEVKYRLPELSPIASLATQVSQTEQSSNESLVKNNIAPTIKHFIKSGAAELRVKAAQRANEVDDLKAKLALKETIRTHYRLQETRSDNFSHWIFDAHKQTDVPIGFITALIASESSFRYDARSSVGAIGPAQVRPSDWQAFCGLDLKDPEQNILCGAKALHHLYQSPACKEDWACAFAHYNVGRGNLLKNRFPGAAERYIERIKSKLNMAPELWPIDISLDP